jgi:O-antigen/teichoic acid export membrane protein
LATRTSIPPLNGALRPDYGPDPVEIGPLPLWPAGTGPAQEPRSGGMVSHLLGAGAAKFAPPLAQFILLLLVARVGTLDDVGLLSLASAAAFLCGALAEMGLATTLSMPAVVFGTDAPPLRGTRRLRLWAGVAGCLVYIVLWLGGVGKHNPALLILIPLPYMLAVASGYSGAMNAAGKLSYEIPISIGETIVILAIALLGSLVLPALTVCLLGLTVGRGLGLVARTLLMKNVPLSDQRRVPRAARAQLPYALATVAFVVQGQADMVMIGFFGALATAAVYGPLLRTAYSTLLSAEALSWALFGSANPDESEHQGWIARQWRTMMIVAGVVVAALFVVLAQPFLHFLLNRPLPDITSAVVLFGVVIAVRFVSLTLHVDILRAGLQSREVPVLAIGAVILTGLSLWAASAGSLTGLAAARLASEAPIMIGFLLIRRDAVKSRLAGAGA